MSTKRCSSLLALLAATMPVVLSAQEAALPALLAEADTANPEILAAKRAAEAATARVQQAGA
ncbi:MAG: hypothetical protein KJO11_00175, partial [Gemmatimonadetes bacterium]|nr:hypothetical protein [Gemmatimonadota bacterium]